MSSPPIIMDPLPYVPRLQRRQLTAIDLVVIHCTELPDLATARAYAEKMLYPDSATGNSGHWYVNRDGMIVEYVPPGRVAHHVRGHNAHSVGIELVNRGRWPHWLDSHHQMFTEPYPSGQIAALRALLLHLCKRLPRLHWIAGHETLDTGLVPASDNPAVDIPRKRDPGPLFPWDQVVRGFPLSRWLAS